MVVVSQGRINKVMKELDRIRIVEHFDFELFLEGNHLGYNFENGWSWGYLFTHIVKLKELLELDKDTHYEFKVLLVVKPHIFHHVLSMAQYSQKFHFFKLFACHDKM